MSVTRWQHGERNLEFFWNRLQISASRSNLEYIRRSLPGWLQVLLPKARETIWAACGLIKERLNPVRSPSSMPYGAATGAGADEDRLSRDRIAVEGPVSVV